MLTAIKSTGTSSYTMQQNKAKMITTIKSTGTSSPYLATHVYVCCMYIKSRNGHDDQHCHQLYECMYLTIVIGLLHPPMHYN